MKFWILCLIALVASVAAGIALASVVPTVILTALGALIVGALPFVVIFGALAYSYAEAMAS